MSNQSKFFTASGEAQFIKDDGDRRVFPMDRTTHRAMVEAGYAPLDEYVAEYSETPSPIKAAPAPTVNKRTTLAGYDINGKPIYIDTATLGSK